MEITPALLKKYNEGLCSPVEKQAVDAWLDGQEEHMEDDFPLPDRVAAIGQQIWLEIDPAGKLQPSGREVVRLRRLRTWMAAAAAVLIIVAASMAFYSNQATVYSAAKPAAIAWKTITTGRGQKQQLVLPDGTQVELNNESTIRYPEQFTERTRTIHLTGEAWLQVAKDAGHPFIIHTPVTVLTVLGTAFDLRAYAGEAQTLVTVTEGKVAFAGQAQQQQVVLTAGQQGRYLHSGSMQQQNVYAASYLAWRDNRLVLADQTLPDIAATLQRWYNVEITITNHDLRREHFTGEFGNVPLEQVLKEIAFVIKCHYKIENGKVTIY
jgi:ferric-dicitrate binding protein FerR (iron transport regulator)